MRISTGTLVLKRLRISVALVATVSIGACAGGNGGMPRIAADTAAMPAAQQVASVTIDADSPALATVDKDVFGVNLTTSMGLTKQYTGQPYYSTMIKTFRNAKFGMVRAPLALLSDYYHWKTNSFSSCVAKKWNLISRTTFDGFMQDVAQPLGLDVNITVNYGSNATCTSGGDPNEAAAWVDYANNQMHNGIKNWTIGNEMYYGSRTVGKTCCTTPDFYVPLDAPPAKYSATYARLVAAKFYPLMKAKDPTIKIGVDLVAPENNVDQITQVWDQTVLSKAKFDFVEVHWYPGKSGISDEYLLTKGVSYVTSAITKLRSELAAAGKPHTPIFLGEWGVPGSSNPQWISIVGALFTAMVLGEVNKGGIGMAGDWEGFDSGPCNQSPPGYYTKQTWNTPSLFEAIQGGYNPACPSDPQPPLGTAFPRASATEVAERAFREGDTMFAPTLQQPGKTLRAYGARRSNGYGVLLVNIDKKHAVAMTVTLENDSRTFSASRLFYGKAQYDNSKDNVWTAPVFQSLGSVSGTFCVTLPPWSATAITLGQSVRGRNAIALHPSACTRSTTSRSETQ